MPSVVDESGRNIDGSIADAIIGAWRNEVVEIIENHTIYTIIGHFFSQNGDIIVRVKEERMEMS